MPNTFRLTLVQSKLHWENPLLNLKHFTKLLNRIEKNETDLILLPETFNSGFSMNATKFAEAEEGPTMQWMYEIASGSKASVAGSLVIRDQKKLYNRFVWMEPDGHYSTYSKRHLFTPGKENKVFQQGTERTIIEWKGWKFCPQICYDLRFPVWSRNSIRTRNKQNEYEYDVLLYIANWPAIRDYAWQNLLIARAIENQAYVAGVNRIGVDGNTIEHVGNSVLLDPTGKPISSVKARTQAVQTCHLDKKHLELYRKSFPVLADADPFYLGT